MIPASPRVISRETNGEVEKGEQIASANRDGVSSSLSTQRDANWLLSWCLAGGRVVGERGVRVRAELTLESGQDSFMGRSPHFDSQNFPLFLKKKKTFLYKL